MPSVPITDRKQLTLIPEAKLNAQQLLKFTKRQKKGKLSTDTNQLNEIKEIEKMENSISIYFSKSNIQDPH